MLSPTGELDRTQLVDDATQAALRDCGARADQTLEALAPPGTNGRSGGNPFHHNPAALGTADPSEQAAPETDADLMGSDADQLSEGLPQDNADLQQRVQELEELLSEMMRKEQVRDEQQKELESLVEEKSDVIRELHQKLQETLQEKREEKLEEKPEGKPEGSPGRPVAATPREEELLALHEELEEERRQLKEDEETLMQQMRQMEVQMSRERAEMARQRSELQRLHNDIRHELELASREAELRDRLQPLQRKHQELLHRKGAAPLREAPANPTPAPQSRNGAAATPPAQSDKPNEGGLLRRLFG
jgi:peptidoglycan hydrolase CwlO-like protein